MLMEKVLCIQLKQIGDVLMTTPSIRALKKSNPSAEIHILTQSPSDQIYQYNPNICKIIKVPKKPGFKNVLEMVKQLRKEKYSIVIDFLGLPKTALLSRLTGAKIRIGFNLRGRSLFYTHALDSPNHITYSALQKTWLLTPLGIHTENAQLDFFIHDKDRKKADEIFHNLGVSKERPLVSVSPVSRRDYKIWPAERFAAICDSLVEDYSAQILFLWGPGEYHFIRAVRDKMQQDSLPNYDIPTISQTVAMLEQVDLHFGNDNGPMHFAIAAGRPTVTVFGRPLMKNWIPQNSIQHLAVEFDPGCKSKCIYPKCKLACLLGVTVEAIKEKIDDQMKRRN